MMSQYGIGQSYVVRLNDDISFKVQQMDLNSNAIIYAAGAVPMPSGEEEEDAVPEVASIETVRVSY